MLELKVKKYVINLSQHIAIIFYKNYEKPVFILNEFIIGSFSYYLIH